MRGRVYGSWPIVNIHPACPITFFFFLKSEPRAIGACTLLSHGSSGNHASKVRKHPGCCEVSYRRFVDHF